MIAYFCDQCQKQIPETQFKTPPKAGENLLCLSCQQKRQQNTNNANQLTCDGCQSPVLPIDLKTQKAFVHENAIYCSRCALRLKRHNQSLRQQKFTQIFLYYCFPLLTALILFGIFKSLSSESTTSKENEKKTLNSTTTPQYNSQTPDSFPQNNVSNSFQNIPDPTSTLSTEELLRLQEEQETPKKNISKSVQKTKEPSTEQPPTPKENLSSEKWQQFAENLRSSQQGMAIHTLDTPATQLSALLDIREANSEVINKIHGLLLSPDPLIRATSARILGNLQSARSIEFLIRLVSDSEQIVRSAAQEALQKITGERYSNVKDLNLPEDTLKNLLRALKNKE